MGGGSFMEMSDDAQTLNHKMNPWVLNPDPQMLLLEQGPGRKRVAWRRRTTAF